jgi:hypothetical protein
MNTNISLALKNNLFILEHLPYIFFTTHSLLNLTLIFKKAADYSIILNFPISVCRIYSRTSMSRTSISRFSRCVKEKLKSRLFPLYIPYKKLFMSRDFMCRIFRCVEVFFVVRSSAIYHKLVEVVWLFWPCRSRDIFHTLSGCEDDFQSTCVTGVNYTAVCSNILCLR